MLKNSGKIEPSKVTPANVLANSEEKGCATSFLTREKEGNGQVAAEQSSRQTRRKNMYNQTKRKRLAAKADIVRRRDNRQTILFFVWSCTRACGNLLAQDSADRIKQESHSS